MLEQMKKQAMQQAFKLMSNPKFTKLMSDPRIMNALTKGFELHGQVRNKVEGSLRSFADSLNLATKEEVSKLRRNMSQLESGLVDLRSQLDRAAAKKKRTTTSKAKTKSEAK